MTGTAIIMMALFILIIWGGLVYFSVQLMKHPDETSGFLGTDPKADDDILLKLEKK
ncbi:hypothetical protein CCICO_04015 [Corynebacterium ciconiae DSM 44920]|uniref:methionine/alanine import NSS transporter subunit MetS n=1 Tax=Corynebacterium ciconiae TaxID=227319 RepID=UPI000377E238|nr:methionine/alanine import NSS transporter subunit MetS [Corynebacterium ciconiae]WKD60840.1 hypothetical protein CCICO_04015 [Corynebacterium ciconiae DSM 44920]